MEMIKPSEISARILTLIDESNERIILVSPYIKISKWYKLTNKLRESIRKGIPVEIYVRDDPDNMATFRDLDHLSLPYKKVPHLHGKLYLNESRGIVTSMNLLLSSEINSLEIGCATETRQEFDGLLRFYLEHIRKSEYPIQPEAKEEQRNLLFKEILHSLRDEFNHQARTAWPCIKEGTLFVCTGRNNYSVSIINNYLIIEAYIRLPSRMGRVTKQLCSLIELKVEDLTAMKVTVHPGISPEVIKLSGQTHHPIQSSGIVSVRISETASILRQAMRFINSAEDLQLHELIKFQMNSGSCRY